MKKDRRTIKRLIKKYINKKDEKALKDLKAIFKELSNDFDDLMQKDLKSYKRLNNINERMEIIYPFMFEKEVR